MGDFVRFLMDIAPDLIELGQALFEAFDGDEDEAKRNIRDRRDEIAQNRAARDRELDDRFGDE